jgi:hypothetical protein
MKKYVENVKYFLRTFSTMIYIKNEKTIKMSKNIMKKKDFKYNFLYYKYYIYENNKFRRNWRM